MVTVWAVFGREEEEECEAAEQPAFWCCVARVDLCLDFGLDFLEGSSVQLVGVIFAFGHLVEDLGLGLALHKIREASLTNVFQLVYIGISSVAVPEGISVDNYFVVSVFHDEEHVSVQIGTMSVLMSKHALQWTQTWAQKGEGSSVALRPFRSA